MPAQIREYRQRIRSVKATQKITRAMELMAASRVVKARQRVDQTTPYSSALSRALSALVTNSDVEHPLTTEKKDARRAAVVVCTSNRGLAGAYSANALKESERLLERLRSQGKEAVPYLVGRKAIGFYKFRSRSYQQGWEDATDAPLFETAKAIADEVIQAFLGDGPDSVDEVHIVYTKFVSMVTQEPQTLRLLPLQVVDADELDSPSGSNGHGAGAQDQGRRRSDLLPLYEFEPSATEVLDAVLPQYVTHRIYNCLLQSAACELASRQRAMKAATDNADDLIRTYTRLANQARQAQITQEISEIVGGANALAEAN